MNTIIVYVKTSLYKRSCYNNTIYNGIVKYILYNCIQVNFNYDILLSVNVGDGLRTYYDRTNKVFKPLMEMSIQKHPDVCPSQQDLEKISAVVKSSFSKYQ